LQRILFVCTLAVLAAAAFGQRGAVGIPVAYEGTYAIVAAPTGSVLDAFPLRGVVEVVRTGGELRVSLPGHASLRYVPAGRHRFVATDGRSRLTFDVADGRVQGAYLDGHDETALIPANALQAAIAELAGQLARMWPGGGGAGD
jgi:hypothetical protein